MRIIIFISLLLFGLNASAQVSTGLSKRVHELGDTVQYRISINRAYASVADPDYAPIFSEIPMLRVVKDDVWKKESANRWSKKLDFIVYDTGKFVIPPVAIIADTKIGKDTLMSQAYSFEVRYNVANEEGLAPIRDIMKEGWHWKDFVKPVIIALVLGLVLLAVAYLIMSRKKKEEIVEEIIVVRPAEEIAMEELQTLENEKIWMQGRVKEYQTKLSMTIRKYLENAFKIPAPESTTREIMERVNDFSFGSQNEMKLKEILQLSDMVKYAKADPPPEYHNKVLSDAKEFVFETTKFIKVGNEEE